MKIACEDCKADVDPSEDKECFVEIGNMRRMHREIVLCETCRWLRIEAGAEAIETSPLVYGA